MGSSVGKLNRVQIAKDWQARGFSCDLWVDPPYTPAIGEEILIPARTSHTVRNTGNTTARWLYGYKSSRW